MNEKKYKHVDQLSIKKLDHNNCVMILEGILKTPIIINLADWMKMADVAEWKYVYKNS